MNGMPEMVSAAEAPISATMSGSFSRSWLSTVQTTWVSLRKPDGEQRTDRAVDEARGQHLFLGRAAFALEEAAGDLAGGESLFLIVDGQREEVLAGLRLLVGDGGAEHRGFAIGRQHGAIGLPGDVAGLEDEAAAAPHQFFAINTSNMTFGFLSASLGRVLGG